MAVDETREEERPSGAARRRTRWRGVAAGLLAAVAVVLAAGGLLYAREASRIALDRAEALSVVVLDRDDRLLRAYATKDGHWRLPVETGQVDGRYFSLLMAYEDRNFRSHRGVDMLAMVRAAGLLARHGRAVSGGSTLTMQVVRLLSGEHERTAGGKLRQALRALALERRLTKDQILRIYLRLAPMGGNVEGVRAASLAYFGKEPRRLSTAEAALLVALPQSPKLRRPDRFPETARRARDRVLARAAARGLITAEEMRRAMAERVPAARRPFPMLAPHAADHALEAAKGRLVHRLTLDAAVQRSLEALVAEHVGGGPGRLSAAVVAVDHRTGEIIASVGSPGYLDEARAGAVDMTKAVRSPGSTLKPLVYGLAFEAGLAHPETLIEDRPARFGVYVPKNFDQDWHGTVSVRLALAQSLNIPAVKTLDALGPARLYARLSQAGANPVLPRGAEPSLAMALGGLGMRLTDLARLYAGLARQGDVVALRISRDTAPETVPEGQPRLLSPVAAWYVTDILRNAPAPLNAKPGEIAYKTGTSYGFRDAWAAGYDGRHTVAVWVGRPDATATPGLTGRSSAAPILFDAFARIARRREPLPPAPLGVITTRAEPLPMALRRFREAGEGGAKDWSAPEAYAAPPLQIAFPPDRAEIELEDGEAAGITVKVEGGALPLTWLLDGVPVATADPHRREATLPAGTRGFYRLSVIDGQGRADRVTVRVK
ncbi:MAG: penicillin-binding protein 1C [Hyphomicrobiaceae bacterium]|nr:penicillin-binding protein 1C [Hyphomicrobiaceae bacterium]